MTDLSLNEVEVLASKVARGAGYSWGLADDVGRCARKLAAAALPWAEALKNLAADAPMPGAALKAGKDLCPIRTGAMLADERAIDPARPLRISTVVSPLWLAAFAALPGGPASAGISWRAAKVNVRGGHIGVACGDDLLAARADVTFGPAFNEAAPRPARSRGFVSSDMLKSLEAIAARTYVPASEESRAKGAGGARIDDE